MNKQFLFRKASVIHAIKCFKTNDFNIGIQSFETLFGFKNRIQNSSSQEELVHLNQELDIWASQEPIAAPTEIDNLIHKR